jgi:dihydrofolate reductase
VKIEMDMYWEMIVAVDKKGGIAKNGNIPWNIPDDMKFFRETTENHIVVMGKTTYFSLPKKHRPLKNRENYVFTTTPEKYLYLELQHSNLHFISDIKKIKKEESKKVFLIGGQHLYDKLYYLCEVIWITKIKHDYKCDLLLDFTFLTLNYKIDSIVDETNEIVICKYIKANRL